MKKITALFTVILMLLATSAFAAITVEFPVGMTNNTKTFTGFYMNQTGIDRAKNNNATMFVFNSTTGGIYLNGSTGTGTVMNGTVSVFNGTGEAYLGSMFPTPSTVYFNFNQGMKNVGSMTTLAANKVTNATTYFVNTSGYSFMVGLSNSSMMNATKETSAALAMGDASSMQIFYDNGTTLGSTFSTSNTWDYYAFGVDNSTQGYFIIGAQVKLNTQTGNDNAQAKFYNVDGTTTEDKTTAWIDYNATTNAAGSKLSLSSAKGDTLFDYATINADRNVITGFVNGTTSGDVYYAVMIKNGATLSSNDLKNRAFKLVYSGVLTTDAKDFGNATGGVMAFSVDSNLQIDGNGAFINGTQKGKDDYTSVNLSGYSVALADTTQFGLTQSNMTIYSTDASTVVGQFYGKQAADKSMVVGFYEPAGGVDGMALAFLVPNPAVTAAITGAGAAYQANSTLTLHGITTNTTAYSQTALRAQWSGIPSNFTPLTEVKGFNATYTEAQKGNAYYTFQFKFTGIGDKIENLRLYKVFPTSAKTVRSFNYAGSATPSTEGAWWISDATADGYKSSSSVLSPGVEYYVNYVVRDNGSYDYKTAAREIGDPVVFGSVPTSSSSSSSSGCVFNPAAGFGLEWLLLMLAPMVAIVRSRFKK